MSTTKTRISQIGTVIIPVADQDRALEFYCGTLGMEKRTDVAFGDKYRWIEVAPADATATIALAPPPEGTSSGGAQTGISLNTSDIDSLHSELAAAGVDVDAEVGRMGGPVPPMFWFRDPEANVLLVVESS